MPSATPLDGRQVAGALFRRARETLNRSPEQVGALTQLSGRTVRRLEAADGPSPRDLTVDALATFYGLDPDVPLALIRIERPAEARAWLRDRGAERLGAQVVEALEGSPEFEVELAMRLARQARVAAPGVNPDVQRLIAFLRDTSTAAAKERDDAVDVFLAYLRLAPDRRSVARRILGDLLTAQRVDRRDAGARRPDG
jgi:hypothetical protein